MHASFHGNALYVAAYRFIPPCHTVILGRHFDMKWVQHVQLLCIAILLNLFLVDCDPHVEMELRDRRLVSAKS